MLDTQSDAGRLAMALRAGDDDMAAEAQRHRLADPEVLDLLADEVEAAASLGHPAAHPWAAALAALNGYRSPRSAPPRCCCGPGWPKGRVGPTRPARWSSSAWRWLRRLISCPIRWNCAAGSAFRPGSQWSAHLSSRRVGLPRRPRVAPRG
jgi:hypothetical protein